MTRQERRAPRSHTHHIFLMRVAKASHVSLHEGTA